MDTGFRVKEIWAFLSVDPKDGDEGVIGMMTPTGWMPLIAADLDRLEGIKPVAKDIAQMQNITVRLVKFNTREEVEVIHEAEEVPSNPSSN